MHPQALGGKVPRLELYDLKSDYDEMCNLAGEAQYRSELERLYSALRDWVRQTADPAIQPPDKCIELIPAAR